MARMDDGLLEKYYEYSDKKQYAHLGGVILPTYEQRVQEYEDMKKNYQTVVVPDRATIIKTEGHKDDSEKIRYDLIPPELLDGVAEILTFGAKKYDDRNWEKGMDWHRPFRALMNHMWAWWRGQDNDPETGKSHLWHAACNIAFLMAYEQRNVGKDDRHKVYK